MLLGALEGNLQFTAGGDASGVSRSADECRR
jgi:hypothetical protein